MLTTLRNAWKIEDLRKKLIYTIGILFIFRLGSVIPVPFTVPGAMQQMISGNSAMGDIMGQLNMVSGGALDAASIFALGISPYITSSIVIQLLSIAIPYLENLSKEGPEGQRKISIITRYTTLGLALMQAFAYYLLNKNAGGVIYTTAQHGFSGTFAAIVIVSAFTAGAMLVVWLGEQIDIKGIGNGISLILFVGIISRAPAIIGVFVEMWQKGINTNVMYLVAIPLVVIGFLLMIYWIVKMTGAERRIPVQYAKRVVGRKMYGGQSSFLPIKVAMSGVMPVIFAGAILSIPSMIQLFTGATDVMDAVTGEMIPATGLGAFLNLFRNDGLLYMILYFVLIIGFNYFYVAIQYDPMQMANDLRKQSGAIPGIRPGQPTADFISRTISRITLVGALFIAVIALLPIIIQATTSLKIGLGGTSVIILVNVAQEIANSLESMMMMRHYKGFLE